MPPRRVYLGNLPRDIRRSEIEDLFQDYKPDDITIPPKAQGFAFLIFDDPRDADDAIQELDGTRFSGRRIRVEQAGRGGTSGRGSGGGGGGRGWGGYRGRDSQPRYKRRSPNQTSRGKYCVVLENMPHSASWQDLKDFARDNGAPNPVGTDVVAKSGETVGLLEFRTREELKEAIECLDRQKIVPGRGARHHYLPTALRAFKSDSDYRSRTRSRGRYRSRSRSYRSPRRRSRSRSPRRRGRSRNRSQRRSRDRRRSRDKRESSNEMDRESIDRRPDSLERDKRNSPYSVNEKISSIASLATM